MARAVVSTIGHDRPGLVSDITAIADAHALNIDDSRMTVLGGEFAVLMSLEGEPDALTAFDKELNALCQGDDIAYIFRLTRDREPGEPVRPYRATLVALDHPGIVHAIAGFFSSRQINIRDLNTETQPAAHTGTPIFSVSLIAEIPASVRIHDLKGEFENFCAEADLDGTMEAER